MSILATILDSKRTEIDALRERGALTVRARACTDVVRALRRSPGEPLRLIAEVKRKSPSAGALSRALDPGARALAYAQQGARMVSVLCDGPFFDGAWEHLAEARAALDGARLDVPLLAKEFVLDGAQIDCARAHGADAVLLIARIVGRAELASLAAHARLSGLEPFVEVSDEAELEAALAAEARVVGVNTRDLDTLAMDRARAARVLARIPDGVVAVHLSGLRSPDDVRAVATSRADAALVGEALMREDDPGPLLRALVAAAG